MEEKINKFVAARAKINDTSHESEIADYIEEAQTKYKYTLYNHQINAIHRLLTKMNGLGILAMEMGTGKTPTALVYARLCSMIYGLSVIYMTPSDIKIQWQEEGKKFDGQEMIIIDKIRDMRQLQKKNPTCKFFIVSPDIFCKITNFDEDEKFIVVIDEAHTLRNDGVTSVKIQNTMNKIAAYKILLTATPLINNGAESFNYLKILFPEVFDNRQQFLDFFYEQEKDVFGHLVLKDMKNIPLFFKLFDIVSIKEYKSVALPNLPPKIRTIYSFNNIDDELKQKMDGYSGLVKKVYHTEGHSKTKRDGLDLGKLSNDLYIYTEKSKARQCLPMIREELDKYPDEKFVIFMEHIEPLQYLEKKLPGSIGLTGKTKPKDRMRVIKKMRDKKDTDRIFLATIGAYGKGYNFSPGITRVIFLGLAMTYAEMYQAEDRCHRVDTDRPIYCYWIFCEGSRDKRTLNLIEDKHKMTQALFVGIPEYQEHLAKRERTIEDDNFFDHWNKYFPEKYKEEMEKEKREEEAMKIEESRKRQKEFEEAMEEHTKKRAKEEEEQGPPETPPGDWGPEPDWNDFDDNEGE